MAAPKTIVITIPKELSGTPFVLPRPLDPTTALASKQLSDILSGNFVQVIKEEHTDKMMNDGDKPARKRQRLDHLSMEEKIMRRKLKNRVAAQTARDRKKLRMDQLEAQVTELTEHINELNELTAILTEQNTQLVEKNEALQIVMSKCTCGTTGSQVDEGVNRSVEAQNLVFEGVKIPVTSQIVGSAAGNLCDGSSRDLGSQCTLLPVGAHHSAYTPENCIERLISQKPVVPHTVTDICRETSEQQMVGTPSTSMESSWDVADHDYTKGCQTRMEMSLSAEEDNLITQLTNALVQSTECNLEQSSQGNAAGTRVPAVIKHCEEVTTPDVLQDFLDFENTAILPRATSPITKAQILDFLKDEVTIPSPGSTGSSESGYESIYSPKSVDYVDNSGSFEYNEELRGSPLPIARSSKIEEDCEMSLDIASFNELFPTLF